jgi:FAD:protein FMN transferase
MKFIDQNIRIILLLTITLNFNFCCDSSKYIYNEGFVYGTIYHIIYESPSGKDLYNIIEEKLEEYNNIFSTFNKSSVISKINDNQPVELDPLFINCFNRAMEISKITDGAFDITAGPMVNAWGFGPDQKRKVSHETIDSLKAITGYEKVRLADDRIIKDDIDMKLDMSAIAKGYTCDLLSEFLEKAGCKNYMVEIGGEVVAKGHNEKGRTWTIGISKPDDTFFTSNEIQAKVSLQENALATSGNYRNYYVEEGKKIAHTINPKTGYPVEHTMLSTTVLADNCLDADAFATAFIVMGLEKSIELYKKIPGIEVYFIYSSDGGENQIYMSGNFKKHLKK